MLARQAIELDKPVPCRDGDSRLWFARDPGDLELAKAHCRGCPLRAACLAGAIERREPCGVWGGEIFDRGQILPVRGRRGRPHADRPVRPARAAARPRHRARWARRGAQRPRKAMAARQDASARKDRPPGKTWPPGKTGRPFARCAAERGACQLTATLGRTFRRAFRR